MHETTNAQAPNENHLVSRISHLASPHRLRKHADYQLVYNASRKQFAKQIAYFYALRPAGRRSDTPGPRIGLTVPKALGKAVDRNRIKRRMREAIRAALPLLTTPVDVILHPKRSVITHDFTALKSEVALIFKIIEAKTAPKPTEAKPAAQQP